MQGQAQRAARGVSRKADRLRGSPFGGPGHAGRRRIPALLVAGLALAFALIAFGLGGPMSALAFGGTAWLENYGEEIHYGGGSMFTRRMYAGGAPAYCAEPKKSSPNTGWYHKQEPILYRADGTVDPNSERLPLLRAVLYYGFGGPGFDWALQNGIWGDRKDINGSPLTDDDYWAYTHILVSDVMFSDGDAALRLCTPAFSRWFKQNFIGFVDGEFIDESVAVRMSKVQDRVPRSFSIFMLNHGVEATQTVLSWEHMRGSAAIVKESSSVDITLSNSCYDLSGAQFGLYASPDDALADRDRIDTLTTGSIGMSNVVDGLLEGSYFIRELKPPKGFALTQEGMEQLFLWQVNVVAGELATVTIKDLPQVDRLAMEIRKRDADTSEQTAQGSGTLAGAEFTVRYYNKWYESLSALPAKATRTWVLKTDEQGRTSLTLADENRDTYLVSGDRFYYDSRGKACMPLGTVTIQETKPAEGYRLPENNEPRLTVIRQQGTHELISVLNDYEVAEPVIRGGMRVQKLDADTGASAPQGDATLAGAEFAITSLNDRTVMVDGATYGRGQVVKRITTGPDGIAATSPDCLPYGDYEITETRGSSGGYLANASWRKVVQIRENGVMHELTGEASVPEPIAKGGVEVQKYDAELEGAQPSGDASFEGIELEVKNTSAHSVSVDGATFEPGQVVCTLRLDKNGQATTGERKLPYGTYEIRESESNASYLFNREWSQTFSIREDGQMESYTARDGGLANDPIRGGLRVQKRDVETDGTRPQGDASFEGAEFSIRNVSRRPVKVDGTVYQSGQVVKRITTGTDGVAQTGARDLPFGTYEVTETRAPAGYLLNTTWKASVEIREDGKVYELVGPTGGTLAGAVGSANPEQVIRGGVEVQKYDASLGGTQASGDADFEDIEISVTNESASSVRVDGKDHAPGSVVKVLVLDKAGHAATDRHALPYGTYRLAETKTNQWYQLNSEWSHEFSIREDGHVHACAAPDVSVSNVPNEGLVEVQKRDIQNDSTTPQGGASFEGAEISIKNVSKAPVKVDGIVYQPGEFLNPIYTNAEGRASKRLPEGSYELTETKAPKGYKLNETWRKVVHIVAHGSTHSLTDETGKMSWQGKSETSGVGDLVRRGDVRFNKVGFPDQGRMGLVAFLVSSDTTGERHLVVTDENGSWDSSSAWNSHGDYVDDDGNPHQSNGNDALLAEDGKGVTDESRLDPLAGLWFFGSKTDLGAAPDNSLGALPYDTYTFTEIRTSANQGYQLVSFKVRITRDAYVIDMGTVSDTMPSLDSVLSDGNGNHELGAASELTLTDTVEYDDVVPGRHYALTMRLWDATAGAFVMRDGAELEVTERFTPTSKRGTVRQRVTIDASVLTGHTLVAYEYLRDESGTLVASHEDPDDEDQSVSFARISTSASAEGGGKVIPASATVRIVDKVSYEGLRPGADYELRATIHLRGSDGSDAGALKSADGTIVKSERSFTAAGASGSVAMELEVDATELAGRTLVVYEELTRGGRIVASHASVADDEQAVSVPAITTAARGEDGSKVVRAAQDATLVDTVSYKGLEPGVEYELVGTLHLVDEDGSDAGSARRPDGSEIRAGAKFTPDSADGSVDVTFSYDATALGGARTVVYETLLRDGVVYATHADIGDEGQTVSHPSLATEATDEAGNHELPALGQVIVRDRVSYHGLVPGRAYVVTGALHDQHTGKPATTASGEPLTSSATFIPEKPDGEVVVTFELDGKAFAGRSLVAFETLSSEGKTWAVHADLEDTGQTVTFPRIRTEARGADGGRDVAAAAGQAIVDAVAYENLTPGATYRLTGFLVDAEGGETLKAGDGSEVVGYAEFVPTSSSGTVEVRFDLDASELAGRTLVVFEYLSDGTRDVATHTDPSDEAQTIWVPSIRTHATGEDGEGVARASGDATITDTVTYQNLLVGEEYELQGELHLRASDGSDAGPLLDESGKPATATTTFTPASASGSVQVTFAYDARGLQGREVVVFQVLVRGGRVVAKHADIADRSQSVRHPVISTTATDPTGSHEVPGIGRTKVEDRISFEGLVPGRRYEAEGILMDASTGEPAKDAEGRPVTARREFTPQEESGSVTMTFEFDATEQDGRRLVAFETLSSEGKTWATHEDLEDEGQTVTIPRIGTSARGIGDTRGILACKEQVVCDTVSYEGLTPGKNYELTAFLIDAETGKALTDHEGNEIVGHSSLVPSQPSGTTVVTLSLDASALSGRRLVAFEYLSDGTRDVATHTDLADEAQTVVVRTPSIETDARDVDTGSQETEPLAHDGATKLRIRDTVRYDGLVTGVDYELRGALMDRATGRELEGSEGLARSVVTFRPERPEGEVEVEFEVEVGPDVAGHDVVVFETLSIGDVVCATHEDLDDRRQTVRLTPPPDDAPPLAQTGANGAPVLATLVAAVLGLAGYVIIRRRGRW